MKKWLLILCSFIGFGCATHYHKVNQESLVLYLKKPDARQVILYCSADDFIPHEAAHIDGKWVVSIPMADQFRYFYEVDGKLFIPSCLLKEKDDFGSENCVFDSFE